MPSFGSSVCENKKAARASQRRTRAADKGAFMSERGKLAHALVDALLHPNSECRETGFEKWRDNLDALTKRGVGAAATIRGETEAMAFLAAAQRLDSAGNLNKVAEVTEALIASVNRIEKVVNQS